MGVDSKTHVRHTYQVHREKEPGIAMFYDQCREQDIENQTSGTFNCAITRALRRELNLLKTDDHHQFTQEISALKRLRQQFESLCQVSFLNESPVKTISPVLDDDDVDDVILWE